MPVYIECSSCHRKLRVRTELLGKTVRCPSCRAKFLATAAEGPAAPSGEGGQVPAEAAANTESSEAAPPPPGVSEAADESSGPTVRRPRPAVVEEPMAPNPLAAAAITVLPAAAPPAPPMPSPALGAGSAPSETPWEKVGLVVGLILLGVMLLGLAGAWWVHAGVRASDAKPGPARRAALAGVHPPRAAAACFRPCPSLRSPASKLPSA